ncbi:MAG: VOC family protein [Bacteroidota bacterium]
MKPSILLILWFCSTTLVTAQLRFEGVKIQVNDLKAAKSFYHDILGFEIAQESEGLLQLKTGTFPIQLEKVEMPNGTDFATEANAKIAFHSPNLLGTIRYLSRYGVDIVNDQIHKNGVGIHVLVKDPAGNMHSIMEVQSERKNNFQGFKIYNTGFTVSSMEESEKFYVNQLGFEVLSRNYLPNALPLKHLDETFAFMLHTKKNTRPAQMRLQESQTMLIFKAPNLEQIMQRLEGLQIIQKSEQRLVFADPSGIISEIQQK